MKKYLVLAITSILVTAATAVTPKLRGNVFVSLKTKNETSQIVARQMLQFSLLVPELAGTLRLGVIRGGESRWAEQLKSTTFINKKGVLEYQLKDTLLGKGYLSVKAVALTVTDGIILEIEAVNTTEGLELFWAAGAASGKTIDAADALLKPEWCKDNVFVMERNDLSLFYGESMKLKIYNYVFPVETESRLGDAHQQTTPLQFFNSGKKTDAHALVGKFPIIAGKKYYICAYRQNKEADFDYSLLPAVFSKAIAK